MVKSETNDFVKIDCGIIMPISANENYTTEHWADILSILREVIKSAGFEPNLVSDADDIGIIHKRIIQNIYNNNIIVCDVSSKNPNVMFELGMRLAFDKPTIIIKDSETGYNFDTAPIEHLTYPRDLRFNKIVEFKDKLKQKLESTYKASQNSNYSTFLKNFGEYRIAHLEQKEVSSEKYLLTALEEMRGEIRKLSRIGIDKYESNSYEYIRFLILEELSLNKIEIDSLKNEITRNNFIKNIYSRGNFPRSIIENEMDKLIHLNKFAKNSISHSEPELVKENFSITN